MWFLETRANQGGVWGSLAGWGSGPRVGWQEEEAAARESQGPAEEGSLWLQRRR